LQVTQTNASSNSRFYGVEQDSHTREGSRLF
jgi:hypothetical protein